MPADRPELIADFDPEIENQKLQKLLKKSSRRRVLSKPDLKSEEKSTKEGRTQFAKGTRDDRRAIQTAAENYALGKSGMLDAMKGIGFGIC